MAAASAVGMTDITHLDLSRNFQGKFIAFETESRSVPPNSDYYTLPSFGLTRFGFCNSSQPNYAIRILPLLKSAAKDTSVQVDSAWAKPELEKITTLFRMRVASNDECKEILSALKDDTAKVAYLDKRGAMELFDPLLLHSAH